MRLVLVFITVIDPPGWVTKILVGLIVMPLILKVWERESVSPRFSDKNWLKVDSFDRASVIPSESAKALSMEMVLLTESVIPSVSDRILAKEKVLAKLSVMPRASIKALVIPG